MNFQQIVDAIYGITGRPDRVALTQSAVASATVAAHCLDFFPLDRISSYYQFEQEAFIQALDITQLPRYRAMAFFRKVAVGSTGAELFGGPEGLIKIIDPDDIFDGTTLEKSNIGYLAGSVFNIKSSTPFIRGLVGWYQLPSVDPVNYSSWIADRFPHAIIYLAASEIMIDIGMVEAGKAILAPGGPGARHIKSLLISNVTGVGS